MNEVIHPNPIVKIISLIILGLIFSAIIFQFFSKANFFLQAMVVIWGGVILLTMLLYALNRFIYLKLTEDAVEYKEGVLSIKRVHIHFNRMTSVNMHQTLVERIFGLGTIQVDTASGPLAEIEAHDMPYSALKKIVGEINEEMAKKKRR